MKYVLAETGVIFPCRAKAIPEIKSRSLRAMSAGKGSYLCISSLAVVSELYRCSEEFLYTAEDVLERELLSHALRIHT